MNGTMRMPVTHNELADYTATPHRTLEEVAALLGITRARVWQIERAALAKMKRHPAILELAQEFGFTPEE